MLVLWFVQSHLWMYAIFNTTMQHTSVCSCWNTMFCFTVNVCWCLCVVFKSALMCACVCVCVCVFDLLWPCCFFILPSCFVFCVWRMLVSSDVLCILWLQRVAVLLRFLLWVSTHPRVETERNTVAINVLMWLFAFWFHVVKQLCMQYPCLAAFRVLLNNMSKHVVLICIGGAFWTVDLVAAKLWTLVLDSRRCFSFILLPAGHPLCV